MRPSDVRLLATDYDRTLTDEDLRPVPEALDALRGARKAGLRVVVVSGRDAPFLYRELGAAADAIVAENGALLVGRDGRVEPLHKGEFDLRRALQGLRFPVEIGHHLASADVAHEALLREALQAARLEVDLIRNRDRVMVLPRGIDKAAGLLAALSRLGVPPEEAAAAGDGENDLAMLSAVGYGIAVANAVPELKAVARHVTRGAGGLGLAEWIEEVWRPAREGAA